MRTRLSGSSIGAARVSRNRAATVRERTLQRRLIGGRLAAAISLMVLTAAAGVVDRVAVVVGDAVITESEVLDELRLTEFLNSQPLDTSPEQRRAAAERLVDQQLIRKEMEIGHYPEPSAAESGAILQNFRQQHFPTPAAFRAALEKYGITEEHLKRHLLWQMTAMRFTDVRFRPGIAGAPEQTANRTSAGAAVPASGADVDQQMSAWLQEARNATRITFKKEAFQ
jgi:hypothetical protein